VRRNKNTKKKQRNNRRELNEKKRPTEMSRLLVLYYTQGLKPLPQECKAQEIPPDGPREESERGEDQRKCSRKEGFNAIVSNFYRRKEG